MLLELSGCKEVWSSNPVSKALDDGDNWSKVAGKEILEIVVNTQIDLRHLTSTGSEYQTVVTELRPSHQMALMYSVVKTVSEFSGAKDDE